MEEKILFNLDKRSVELTIEIPYEMFEKMKEIKEAYGLSYAEFVRNAIAEKLVKSQV